jgi:hypothetical protein
MLFKTAFVTGIFVCIVASGPIDYALAGDVKLVSDTWDNVCGVEISWGPNAPDDTHSEHFVDVETGWSITKPDKLCYRRAATPDNCDSGMTQWKTPWRCATKPGAGVEELSLQ